jgi:Trk K+ transport system NAD-binding subunit
MVRRSTYRLLLLLASLPLIILLFALFYKFGMTYIEGKPHTLWASLEWAAETLTTTGYGGDARWTHPIMVIFVILVQFSGLFLVFLIFPIYVLPFFEERFEARLPRILPKLAGEVLIYRYGPAVISLISELRRFGYASIIVETDETTARRLKDRGETVVLLDINEDRLDGAPLQGAHALIANGSDHENATLVISAREAGYRGSIYALAEDPLHRPAMITAGADVVFTPRHVLAAALAARASERISPSVSGVQQIGRHVGVTQLRIKPTSPLAGRSLAEAQIRESIGATVIGIWHDGELVNNPNAETRLNAGSIIIAIGGQEALARLGELAFPFAQTGTFIVAGYGDVGRKTTEFLRDAGEQVRVVNDRDEDGVDIVGNILHTATLNAAAVREARAVILTIGNDSGALFAAAVVREYAPDVPLLARVNQDRSVERLHRLGVDFALSIGQVAGQILAHHLLGEDYVGVEPNLKVVEIRAEGMVGHHPWRAGVREATGCQVVAVRRGDELQVEYDPDFRVDADDILYLCGAGEAIDAYFRAHPGARPQR